MLVPHINVSHQQWHNTILIFIMNKFNLRSTSSYHLNCICLTMLVSFLPTSWVKVLFKVWTIFAWYRKKLQINSQNHNVEKPFGRAKSRTRISQVQSKCSSSRPPRSCFLTLGARTQPAVKYLIHIPLNINSRYNSIATACNTKEIM